MIRGEHYSWSSSFPLTRPFDWIAQIPRANQLDRFSQAIFELFWQVREKVELPVEIILASPQASNYTDRDFAAGGATSPSKFVHTLPNIRILPFAQWTQWHGRILCIQKDPSTMVHGLIEGVECCEWDSSSGTRWVVGSFQEADAVDLVEAHLWILNTTAGSVRFQPAKSASIISTDQILLENLRNKGPFQLDLGYGIVLNREV